MRRLLLVATVAAALAGFLIPAASASVRVLPLSAQPNGWTYHQWHAIYNQRYLARDFRSLHSLAADRNGQCGQRVGQVKARLLPISTGGALSATCRIQAGTRLVVDVAGAINIYGGPTRLRNLVRAGFSQIQSTSLTLDGWSLRPHVIQTPFIHADVPYYNAKVLGVPKTTISLISRDYFAILSPISRGWHTLVVSGTYATPSGWETDSITFHLNVR